MKKLARTLVLALAVSSVVGCAKASDLAAKQQETVAYAKSYNARLAELFQRGKDYPARVDDLASELGGAEARTTLASASTIYRSMKVLVDSVPGQIEAAIKAGKPEELRKIATSLDVHTTPPNTAVAPPTDMVVELQRVMDNLNARLEDGYIESNAKLDAVEAWLYRMEGRHGAEPAPVAHPAPTGKPAEDDRGGEPDDKA
ncbi:MAG: hypothetical protein KIT31_43730, partial [Deltaproteobacteria bacterium]|nr:hypothetical protein [Deltaproteobacteria bacterium]